MITVLLDFSKAFDTINRSILLEKLQHNGVRGTTNDWFASYLSNRNQRVNVGEHFSEFSNIDIGVPQGTVLAPLLFLIYINDMHNAVSEMQLIHFADDTTAVQTGSNLNNLINDVNIQLEKIDKWLCTNRLSLNISKTTYMIMSNRITHVNSDIIIRNNIVSRSSSAKFLGIDIDDKLTFKPHTDNV